MSAIRSNSELELSLAVVDLEGEKMDVYLYFEGDDCIPADPAHLSLFQGVVQQGGHGPWTY
jgi:hypothetical protein